MSLMPNFYAPPFGTPLYWRDEQSGELRLAVTRYFDHCLGPAPDATAADLEIPPLTARELNLLAEYCRYFINAPCWQNNLADNEAMLGELRVLIEKSKTLASVESIRRWNEECADLGLDVF